MTSPLRATLRQRLGEAMRGRDRAGKAAARTVLAALDNAEAVPLDALPGRAQESEAQRLLLSADDERAVLAREVAELRASAAVLAGAGSPRRAAGLEQAATMLEGVLVEVAGGGPLRLAAVTCDAHDPDRLAAFWAALLGREVVVDPAGPLLPGGPTQVGLRFVAGPAVADRPALLHLHVTSEDDQQRRVAVALALGARHLDVGQRADEPHVVLADPEGNAFCVIEPGNGFLAGCGPLGEVACDGTREVGLFWSAALGWPLVWDQDGESAVQSPHGGTKVAWSGESGIGADGAPGRQRLELAAGAVGAVGLEATVSRLALLGATRDAAATTAAGGPVVLRAPGGEQLWLRPG